MIENIDQDIIEINPCEKPSKIIFLDIDGVLNKNINMVIYRSMILRLKKIIDATGAKVVLSSTWRLLMHNALPLCIELSKFGIDVIDFTPNHSRFSKPRGHRGLEIKEWFTQNWYVKKDIPFVILDDDMDVNETYPNNVVNTHPLTGIDDEDVKKAIEILNRKDKNE